MRQEKCSSDVLHCLDTHYGDNTTNDQAHLPDSAIHQGGTVIISLLGFHSHAAFSPSSAYRDHSQGKGVDHLAHTTSWVLTVSAEVPLGFPMSYVPTALVTDLLTHFVEVLF